MKNKSLIVFVIVIIIAGLTAFKAPEEMSYESLAELYIPTGNEEADIMIVDLLRGADRLEREYKNSMDPERYNLEFTPAVVALVEGAVAVVEATVAATRVAVALVRAATPATPAVAYTLQTAGTSARTLKTLCGHLKEEEFYGQFSNKDIKNSLIEYKLYQLG